MVGVAKVDAIGQLVEAVVSRAAQPVGLGNHRGDIGQRFARLIGDISRVNGAVPEDTRRSGYEQELLFGQANQCGTRERRTAWPVFGRVIVGADLPGVFDWFSRLAAGHESDA